jgi:DMSO/TMAO reductase YedYZ molybdopterin-dependent catalytic subunit
VPLGSELRGKALANYVVATGSDGYQATLALGEIDPTFHPGEVLVADTMDGKPLDAHSGPLKLVVTEDKRPARSVRNLTAIELKSAQ